jgi:PilZ domain
MEERRKDIRRRTLKAAKIMIDGKSVIDCTVRNLTDTGASLEVGTPVGIPDTFELSIPVDNLKRKCRVTWRQERKIGVQFV